MIGGRSIDLVKWAGLLLSEKEQDKLWGKTDPVQLIASLPSADIEREEFDSDWPGQSDVFFSVFASEGEEVLRQELTAAILEILA